MESELAKTVDSPNHERRFRHAVDTLRRFYPQDEPIRINGSSTLELGYSSITFDHPANYKEGAWHSRYSISMDGKIYGAGEDGGFKPVGDVEAEAVLGILESEVAKVPLSS